MDYTLLSRMVATQSSYPREHKLGELLRIYLAKHGFRVGRQRVSDNRYNIFAEKGSSGRAILFYGHLDTVPIEVTGWHTDPYVLTLKKDRYYGAGAYDMKGGIAAFIDACTRSSSHTKLFLACDEENISEGAWVAVRSRRLFFSDVDLIISAEPNFDRGLESVTRGRTGRFIFDVHFEGKAAHLARHKEGIDAIRTAADFVIRLQKNRSKLFGPGGSFVQVRQIAGEAVGMSIAEGADVQVEVLAGYKETVNDCQKKIESLTPGRVSLRARKTPYLTGYYFNTFPHQLHMGKVIRRKTGKAMKLETRVSVGDDNVLATIGIPVVTWGPDGANAHAANEYVNKSSLAALSDMYYEFLAGMG